MLSKKFLATCTVTAGLLTAASSNAVANWGSNANAAAAAQYLERGGSFYAVTDAQSIKPQIQYILKSIFSRFPAATAQKLESYQNIFDMGCTIAGINDVQAIGQSSKVMIPARNGKPAIYHNRLVITTANKGKLPLFMQVANGTPAKLQQVASIIPDNAKYAVYGSLNPMPLYNAIDGMGLIPADFKNEFKTNMGCQISAGMIDPSRGGLYTTLYTLLVLTYSAFCLTSLDTATRLARFMFQEFWLDGTKGETPETVTGYKKVLTNPYVATLITVVLGVLLGLNGYGKIWALFGSANQLLAALGLLAVATWLGNIGKDNKMFLLPMTFMLCVTIASLAINTKTQVGLISAGGADWGPYVQAILGVIMIVLAVVLAIEGIVTITKQKKAKV